MKNKTFSVEEITSKIIKNLISILDVCIIKNLMWSNQVPNEYWAIVSPDNCNTMFEDLNILHEFNKSSKLDDFCDTLTHISNQDMFKEELPDKDINKYSPVGYLTTSQVNRLDKIILNFIYQLANYIHLDKSKLNKNLVCIDYLKDLYKSKK